MLKQFYQASPRLIFAVLIAVVIARPLELKIFDKEIREQLGTRYLLDQQQRIVKVQAPSGSENQWSSRKEIPFKQKDRASLAISR